MNYLIPLYIKSDKESMDELFDLGLSDETLKNMIELNPLIMKLSNEEVLDKINLLKSINCSSNQISNIIGSNSMLLTRSNTDIIKLINYLNELGFSSLNILFDSNPYILNLDIFEIKNYIEDRISNGESLEDIIDDLDSNTYLFNEI